jgi:hypothetical protein
MTELELLKKLHAKLVYKNPYGLRFTAEYEFELLEKNDYDTDKVKEILKSFFPLTQIATVITSDRRYDRYYSILYQHNVSKNFYVNKNCLCVGGDDEFRRYHENLIEISDSEADIFVKWCNLSFMK